MFNKLKKFFKNPIVWALVAALMLCGAVFGIRALVDHLDPAPHQAVGRAATPTCTGSVMSNMCAGRGARSKSDEAGATDADKSGGDASNSAKIETESDVYKILRENPDTLKLLTFDTNNQVTVVLRSTKENKDEESFKVVVADEQSQQDLRMLALEKNVAFGMDSRYSDRLESELYQVLKNDPASIDRLEFATNEVLVVPHEGKHYGVVIGGALDQQALRKLAIEHNVDFTSGAPKSKGLTLGSVVILIALLGVGGFFVFLILRKNPNAPKGPGVSPTEPKASPSVTFADVVGLEEPKKYLLDFGEVLKHPELMREHDVRMPRGLLLSGDPGSGKTLLARAAAGELDVEFIAASGAEFVEKFVGQGASRVRALFARARKVNGPVIIFIDEIDAIGGKRGSDNHPERDQTLDQLLVELDGIRENAAPILVIAATNRPHDLDNALVRPGRIDRKVAIPALRVDDRINLFVHYTKNKKVVDNLNFQELAEKAAGLSAAQIANVCNESALSLVLKIVHALGLGKTVEHTISQEDLLKSIEKEVRQSPKNSIASRYRSDNPITMDMVIGNEDQKVEAWDIIDAMRDPQSLKVHGAKPPSGMLMTGPPGTGKTYLGKAMAYEAGVPFFYVNGADFVRKYVGQGAERMQAFVDEVKANAPCVAFIDEIDAVGGKRKEDGHLGNDQQEQALNTLLTGMDGFEDDSAWIVWLGATNRPDMLDDALTRSGRLERTCSFDLPLVQDRLALFEFYMREKSLDEAVDLKHHARNTARFSPADIESACNDAVLLQRRENRAAGDKYAPVILTDKIIDEAITRQTIGNARQSVRMSDEDKLNTAVHEGGGHAAVAQALGQEMARITIMARGQSGGHVQFMNDDVMYMTKDAFLKRIAVALGGRAAQEIILNVSDTGASSDFQNAAQMSRSMVVDYGWSPLGVIAPIRGVEFSQQQTQDIERETQAILQSCDALARRIITENRARIDVIVQALLDRETILGSEYVELWKSVDLPEQVYAPVIEIEAETTDVEDDVLDRPVSNIIDASEEFAEQERGPRGLTGRIRGSVSRLRGLVSIASGD